MTFDKGKIVVVPFPFVNSLQSKPRPVLVLSSSKFNKTNKHLVGTMITSALHTSWEGDTEISELKPTGLSKPSIIRLKMFSIDLNIAPREIGTLSKKDWLSFRKNFTAHLPS